MTDLDPLVVFLTERRKKLGLTQQQVAERIGQSSGRGTIARWECGRMSPAVFSLRRWAEALGVEIIPNVWDEPNDTQPFVTMDPAMRSGRPTINHTRLPVEAVIGLVAHGGIDEAMASYLATRPDVLVACWWAGTYGPAPYKRLWGEWAKQVHGELWSCRYDVPDPPGRV